jgi:hypothetical protein
MKRELWTYKRHRHFFAGIEIQGNAGGRIHRGVSVVERTPWMDGMTCPSVLSRFRGKKVCIVEAAKCELKKRMQVFFEKWRAAVAVVPPRVEFRLRCHLSLRPRGQSLENGVSDIGQPAVHAATPHVGQTKCASHIIFHHDFPCLRRKLC